MVADLEAQAESLEGPKLQEREQVLKEVRQGRRLAWVLEAAAGRALVRVVGQEWARIPVGVRVHALLEAARWWELHQELAQPVLVEVVRLVRKVELEHPVGALGLACTRDCQQARSGCPALPQLALALALPSEQVDEVVPSLFASSFPHPAPSAPSGDP